MVSYAMAMILAVLLPFHLLADSYTKVSDLVWVFRQRSGDSLAKTMRLTKSTRPDA